LLIAGSADEAARAGQLVLINAGRKTADPVLVWIALLRLEFRL
jgi:hypothetical protein